MYDFATRREIDISIVLPKISAPTTAQYRTVPWRPYNVTFNEGAIGPDFFEVRWSGPREITEFDRYQVSECHVTRNYFYVAYFSTFRL